MKRIIKIIVIAFLLVSTLAITAFATQAYETKQEIVEPASPNSNGISRVTASALHLRDAPNGTSLGLLMNGDRVSFTWHNWHNQVPAGGLRWVSVIVISGQNSGRAGWVASQHLSEPTWTYPWR